MFYFILFYFQPARFNLFNYLRQPQLHGPPAMAEHSTDPGLWILTLGTTPHAAVRSTLGLHRFANDETRSGHTATIVTARHVRWT